MPINGKQKGNRGERALRDVFRQHGYTARRTQQYCGNTGDASDVTVGQMPNIHWECKNTEAKNFLDWLSQAERDSHGKIPIVAHKRNRKDWIAILRLDDLIALMGHPSLVAIDNSDFRNS